jgi:hypothetical protein
MLRLDAWSRNNTTLLYRSLNVERTDEMLLKMGMFVEQVSGKSYGYDLW